MQRLMSGGSRLVHTARISKLWLLCSVGCELCPSLGQSETIRNLAVVSTHGKEAQDRCFGL